MAVLSLVIFNEEFWNKGLIYSQNIKPLLEIRKNHPEYSIEFISFTSIALYFRERQAIKKQTKSYKNEGIKVHLFPILFYPTKYMVVNWFLLPWFILNCFFYNLWLSLRDLLKGEKITYILRSYQTSLAFLLLYFGKGIRVFDTRTDWIEEARGMGYWKTGGFTDRMWVSFERRIMNKFNRTLFISDSQKNDTLKRTGLLDSEKFSVFYNQADYSRFGRVESEPRTSNFVYSGSLGHWNNLPTYLDFFMKISPALPGSKLYVLTPTAKSKVEPVLCEEKYKSIIDRVIVVYNVPYTELPNYYAHCRFGLQLMEKADSRVGVKYVEYVAAGLIPIVHENVRGAAYIVENMGLGVVVDNTLNDEKIDEIKNASINKESYLRFKAMTDEKESNDILYNFLTC